VRSFELNIYGYLHVYVGIFYKLVQKQRRQIHEDITPKRREKDNKKVYTVISKYNLREVKGEVEFIPENHAIKVPESVEIKLHM
jgi:hypothetical protein